MKKLLLINLIALIAIYTTGCATQPSPENDSNLKNQSSSTSQDSTQTEKFSMAQYYDTFSTTDKTVNVGQLTITNNGVTKHDLISTNDNIACQTYLENAKKVDLEITNNYSETITYQNSSTDIWGIASVMTDKTIEFLESGDLSNSANVLSDEFYGTLTPYLFQGDYLGTCFQQQNNVFTAQPGETINYPLYFSLPDRWTQDAQDWYLTLTPDTYLLPQNNPLKEIETQDPVILKLEI